MPDLSLRRAWGTCPCGSLDIMGDAHSITEWVSMVSSLCVWVPEHVRCVFATPGGWAEI